MPANDCFEGFIVVERNDDDTQTMSGTAAGCRQVAGLLTRRDALAWTSYPVTPNEPPAEQLPHQSDIEVQSREEGDKKEECVDVSIFRLFRSL